jgi:LL-diaminopimelate aminotransferase
MFLNYPHNPTGAVASRPFLEETVEIARRHDLLIAYDLAYAQIVLQGPRPALGLRPQAGAEGLTIEFFTFSKSYDMQGYRLGAAVGNPDLLQPLRKVHENFMAGTFLPIQAAGRAALDPHEDAALEQRIEGYRHRQELLHAALTELGAHVTHPFATVYLWLRAPRDLSGERFAQELLRGAGIAVTPGSAFGQQGHAYVRISLTAPDRVIEEAVERLRRAYPQGLEARPQQALQPQ